MNGDYNDESEEHNIFKYATKELSQDAVICWILSFYNDKNSKLYNLARDLLSSFVILTHEDDTIEINKQVDNIDILIHLPNTKKVVIIEDKTYSSEHDEQIATYVETISKNKKYRECKIYPIYFKTGFYYDNDKSVEHKYLEKFENFKSIHGKDFQKILQKYINIDSTLDMYIEHLNNLINWYDTHGKITDKNDEGKWNVSKEYIAQYNLMREIFPEDIYWKNKNDINELYKVKSGSSHGRPKTWTNILKKDNHAIFWRIDTDSKGPYLSLRYYNKYKDSEHSMHIAEYQKYYECAKKACGANEYCKVRKQENYFEATLLHIHISDILSGWNEKKEEFIKEINDITKNFLYYVANND